MKPYCVTCPNKLKLEQIDDFMFICPRCRKSYNLYYEVMAYEDELETSHEDEAQMIETAGISSAGPLMEFIDDNSENLQKMVEQDLEEESRRKGNIPIPKYMKDSEGSTVTYYNEDID